MADVSPVSRTDDWVETVADKLRQVGKIAWETKAQAVLDGGDFFHIKSPARTSHRTLRRTVEVHRESYPCPVYANFGNHDSVYSDLRWLHQQPLGVLFETGVFLPLYDEHEALFEKDGVRVRVVGVPYHGTSYDLSRLKIAKGEEDYLVVVAHLLASDTDKDSFYDSEDVVRYSDLRDLDADVFCFLPGTQVLDWNGRQVPIEEVGRSVALSGRATPVIVEQVHPPREYHGEVVSLDVEGVPSTLLPGATLEHPFWVAKGVLSYPCSSCDTPPEVSPEWVAAEAIDVGDFVSIPVPQIPSKAVSSPGLARLLGYYLAEGHLIENRGKDPVAGVGFSFHSGETSLHQHVAELVREHFDREVHSHPAGPNCVQLCTYGPEIASFCGENGGRYSTKKEVSPWVWRLDARSRLELLVGWLLGDGHARNPERYDRTKVEVMGATSSPNLASQMFLLSLSLGLRATYFIRPGGKSTFPGGIVSDAEPSHIISFYGDDAEMLGALMGVSFPEREKTRVSGFFQGGLYWARVRGVSRKSYQGLVYNMRTSTQEYVAGLLLTHNCFGHWHKDQGITEITPGKWVVNIGSLTRGSLSQDNLERAPACAVLAFGASGIRIERRNLRVAPAGDVFDTRGRAQSEVQSMVIDDFARKLREVLNTTEERKSLVDSLREMEGVPEAVRERALLILEQV